ncbi:DNA adenine methylase [Phascolarctobacterium faecium]|uniref:DNA adenine methylase n=1 Tax=Phascolarctobacterium faecium TaxID=33025 RepID=UPI003AB3A7D9
MALTLSPLRYPGGKTQLYNFVNHTININKLHNVTYCEPFSGGAGLAISLLLKNSVNSIILNDFDISVYSIWYAILNDTSALIKKINCTPITIDEWKKQKNIYESHASINSKYCIELAFATLFLNRTNRAGIITGGPIGGFKQKSIYDISCRFKKTVLIKKIQDIAEHKNKIQLFNLDASELISKHLAHMDNSSLFIYFDPPYYRQGKNLYKNFFTHQDHINLSVAIKSMDKFKWIATYDNSNEIKNIYNDRNIYEYKLQYFANKTRKETELLFCSNNTIIQPFGNVEFPI